MLFQSATRELMMMSDFIQLTAPDEEGSPIWVRRDSVEWLRPVIPGEFNDLGRTKIGFLSGTVVAVHEDLVTVAGMLDE